MERLKTTFFEDPTVVYAILAFVELLLAAVWFSRRDGRSALRLLYPLLAGLLVFAVARLVVTDREYLTAAMHEIAADCAAGRVDAAGRYLDAQAQVDLPPPYGGTNLNREQALAVGRKAIKALGVDDVRFTKLTVNVENDAAVVHAATLIRFRKAPGEGGNTSLIWDLEWVERPDGWRIVRVKSPRFGIEW